MRLICSNSLGCGTTPLHYFESALILNETFLRRQQHRKSLLRRCPQHIYLLRVVAYVSTVDAALPALTVFASGPCISVEMHFASMN